MSVLSSRRYLSVWLRRLSTDRIERRLAAPDDSPRVVIATIEQAQRIVAMNDAAARLRLRSGCRRTQQEAHRERHNDAGRSRASESTRESRGASQTDGDHSRGFNRVMPS